MSRCPTCKQPLKPKRIRQCFDCKKPMGSHDKWYFTDRDGYQVQVHRNCEDPTNYVKEDKL